MKARNNGWLMRRDAGSIEPVNLRKPAAHLFLGSDDGRRGVLNRGEESVSQPKAGG